jgi:quercetin dioxygenase-like cupin family protein
MADDATSIMPPVKGKVAIARANAPVYVPGRRDFFKYRELGVTEATDGFMRAQVTIGTQGLTQPTGWHYHICDAQFVYVLKGWVELQFENEGTVRLEEGDSVNIPGNLPHNEIRTSDEIEILEISVPAKLGTKPCDVPAGFKG